MISNGRSCSTIFYQFSQDHPLCPTDTALKKQSPIFCGLHVGHNGTSNESGSFPAIPASDIQLVGILLLYSAFPVIDPFPGLVTVGKVISEGLT